MAAKGVPRKGNYPEAKYQYFGTKHPHEWKACEECGVEGWIQKRRRFCSYRCSKLGDKNPAKQKASNHGLTPSEYAKAHTEVRKARGKADHCIHCGSTEPRMYHWANVSGNYFDVNDYIPLCAPCHDKYDRGKNAEAS